MPQSQPTECEAQEGAARPNPPPSLESRLKAFFRKFSTPSLKSRLHAIFGKFSSPSLKSRLKALFWSPSPPSLKSQLKVIFWKVSTPLLLFVPVGIALELAGFGKTCVFAMNFIAIIPLAAILSTATESLAYHLGDLKGGLLTATCGNIVEIVVSAIALKKKKVLIVQTSLLGSILSNLLLVLGMSIFSGALMKEIRHSGWVKSTLRKTQGAPREDTGDTKVLRINDRFVDVCSTFLFVPLFSLIVPTIFKLFGTRDVSIAPASRGTAVLMLITYACYLYFSLGTHRQWLIEKESGDQEHKSQKQDRRERSEATQAVPLASGVDIELVGATHSLPSDEPRQPEPTQLRRSRFDFVKGLFSIPCTIEPPSGAGLSRKTAVLTLLISTALTGICADFLIEAIDAIAGTVSPEFIGLILLPIIGNVCEHWSAVQAAMRNDMNNAASTTLESAMQIGLFVLPLMILLSWFGVGGPVALTLDFDGFQLGILLLAVVVDFLVLRDNQCTWLEGVLLQIMYTCVALAAWYYPASAEIG